MSETNGNKAPDLSEEIAKGIAAGMAPVQAKMDALEKRLDALPATAPGAGIIDAARAGKVGPTKASRVRAERERVKASDPHKGLGLNLAALVRATATARLKGVSIELAAAQMGYDDVAEAYAGHQKALAEGTLADGGALVPPEFSSEMIELLRAVAVVRSAGPIVMPMPTGSLTIPKQTGGGTGYYVGENTAITKSQQTFGSITLSSKKLAALTPISNDLIRDSSPAADLIVRNDLVRVLANAEDLKFLRGDGASGAPKGIRNWASTVTNATQAGAAATLDEVTADLWNNLVGKLQDNNVVVDDSCVWFWHPRSERYLAQLTDGVGRFIFLDELRTGRFMGYRFFRSTQIPTNLNVGGSSNESEIMFVKMQDAIIGENLALEVEFIPNASYDSGSGTIVSGVSSDQSVVRAIAKHDFALRHAESAAVLNKVKWGV